MKLTFPHMGNTYISLKAFLDDLGIDYCLPPVNSRASLELGMANSPEFMCLPFKKVLGDLIQVLNEGADTVFLGSSRGQCRFSQYGDLLEDILLSMGYRFNYINLNFGNITYGDVREKLGPVLNGAGKARVFSAVSKAVSTMFEVDSLYAHARRVRCREVCRGETDRAMFIFERKAKAAHGFRQTRSAVRSAENALSKIRTDSRLHPVKIGLVGEIFILSDPFTNLETEKKLGSMGAMVFNSMSTSEWMKKHFVRALLPIKPENRAVKAAQKYMHTDYIGGHGIYTIGNAELMSHGKMDGIIQLCPFTCMPEITAKSVLGEIQYRNETPIMTLILDGTTAEAGYVTRLEAFVDMLKMKRESQQPFRHTPKAAL